MGWFSSFLGKKENDKTSVTTTAENRTTVSSLSPIFHLKGYPDAKGLYPSELVMLTVAEKYKVGETRFPAYLSNDYEVTNPAKMLKDLQAREFIEEGTCKDVLPNYKVNELKEIASSLGVSVKGKKADIVEQLACIEEGLLGAFVKDRAWKLTSSGLEEIKANLYIQYFLEKHPYNLSEIGVDIWSVNKDFVKNPKRFYRDIVYRQINEQMNKASIAFQKNPGAGSYNTHQYCECYRLMGLFIEEEGTSYVNAADMYFQYLYKWINIHAGLELLTGYSAFKGDSKYQKEVINRYYEEIQLYPFNRTELLRLIDELNIEGDALRDALITSFKRAGDTGIMDEQQAADFIILELSGEGDKSKELAINLAKQAVKKISNRKAIR